MMYYYGSVEHGHDNTRRVLVRLDIRGDTHGMMHVVSCSEAISFQTEYKEICREKRKLDVKYSRWIVSLADYLRDVQTIWLPMCREFIQHWGPERTPLPLRHQIHTALLKVRERPWVWPPVLLLSSDGSLHCSRHVDHVGGCLTWTEVAPNQRRHQFQEHLQPVAKTIVHLNRVEKWNSKP